jgi:hypothetical protein
MYDSNTLASTALERNVLSTPNITSPSGLPAVSTALETIVPVSPALSTLTLTPVDAVNSVSSTLFRSSAQES